MNTITAFIDGTFRESQDVVALAVDEEGQVLADHVSSNAEWAKHDIGVGRKGDARRATWHDDKYDARYPDGWVVEWTWDQERIQRLTGRGGGTTTIRKIDYTHLEEPIEELVLDAISKGIRHDSGDVIEVPAKLFAEMREAIYVFQGLENRFHELMAAVDPIAPTATAREGGGECDGCGVTAGDLPDRVDPADVFEDGLCLGCRGGGSAPVTDDEGQG